MWLFLAGAALFVYWLRVDALNGYSWDGEGEISIFSDSSDIKNYRLITYMEAKESAFMFKKGYIEYFIDSADWPNGGELNFKPECVIRSDLGMRNNCTDTEGRSWLVELTTPPEKPDSSSYDE